MKMRMKRSYCLRLISSSLLMIILINPVSEVFASGVNNLVSTQKTVTASAVVVPARVAQLGFLISAIAKDIPVKEGDTVKAGQTLMVLDTPDLQFTVDAAKTDVRAAQAAKEIRRNEII